MKDCARGIALLQLADQLSSHTYNGGNGWATRNREIVDAITGCLPNTRIDLPAGRDPDGPGHDTYLDISRIRRNLVDIDALTPLAASVAPLHA